MSSVESETIEELRNARGQLADFEVKFKNMQNTHSELCSKIRELTVLNTILE